MMKNLFPKVAVLLGSLSVFSMAADQCKPIGWATRVGRTSTPFEVTGGGNVAADTARTFDQLVSLVKDSNPRVIYIDGTLGNGWDGNSGDRLNVNTSNKTIIGLKPGTELKAVVYIKKATNIILRNIVIKNNKASTAEQQWDNLNIENAQNVWVDHCEFWNGQDGNADVIKGADNVTFTWCKFGYTINGAHNLSNLIASSDNEPVSEGKLNVTFMNNWWVSASQRMPRCRYGNIHVINNLYTADPAVTSGTTQLGVSAGVQCHVRTEKNVFIGIKDPIFNGNNTDGTGGNEVIDNIFTNCTGNTSGQGTSFTPPYDYSFALSANQVEAAVRAGAGATLTSPTVCDANYVEPTPAEPVPEKAYQAESGTITGGVLESSNTGFAGAGYVNFNVDGSVAVPVTVEKAGEYRMDLDFANGSKEARALTITAGDFTTSQTFEVTSSWTTWKTASVNLELAAGPNTIVFATEAGKDGPNLDQFDLTLVKETVARDTTTRDTVTRDTTTRDTVPAAIRLTASSAKVVLNSRTVSLDGFGALAKNVEVRVFDMNGVPVVVSRGQTAVSLNHLPAGIYMLQVRARGYSYSNVISIRE